MSFFITGLLVGIVSLIPGISGGTIILLRNQYEEISQIISHYQKNKKQIFYLISGVIIGAIFFAKVVELLFQYLPTETIMLFFGFLLFSTPQLIHKEKKNINLLGLIIGALIVFLIFLNIPASDPIITNYPQLTISFLILFALSGCLDGFITILPGISGSMVLMLLGPYYLYKSYLANLSLSNISFLIPLTIYFISDLIGIFIGSKLSIYFLQKHHNLFISIIIGFVVASLIILIPFSAFNNLNTILTSIISLIISYITIEFINFFTNKSTT